MKKLIRIYQIYQSHKKDPDAVYTSKAFKFSNLPKPTNSSRLLLLHILKKMKIMKVLHNKILIKNFLIFDNY